MEHLASGANLSVRGTRFRSTVASIAPGIEHAHRHPPLQLIHLPRFRNCENVISIAAMEALSYRQSRLCRLLGNPIALTVVCLLVENKQMSTG